MGDAPVREQFLARLKHAEIAGPTSEGRSSKEVEFEVDISTKNDNGN
jgi:hypothetical protein